MSNPERNAGSVREMVLDRSILKHLKKTDGDMVVGPFIGNDYARVINKNENILVGHGIADSSIDYSLSDSSEGILSVGKVAMIRAINNLNMGAKAAEYVHIVITAATDIKEGILRSEMSELAEYCSKKNIKIIGGHTEISRCMTGYMFSITAYGTSYVYESTVPKAKPGDVICMTGTAGSYGAGLIADIKKEELKKRFSESYIEDIKNSMGAVINTSARDEAISKGAIYMHDISFGGIYGALAQLSKNKMLGFNVEHSDIPVAQPVIELSEYLDINPYILMGMGEIICIIPSEKYAEYEAADKGSTNCTLKKIGILTEKKEKIVVSESMDMRRVITSVDGDEIYKVL